MKQFMFALELSVAFLVAAASGWAAVSGQSSVLSSIKVDASPYEAAIYHTQSVIQQYSTGTDYESLTSLGNLLLLVDRPKEARTAFERAYALASDKDLVAATESVARSIKAEDGTIGRVNAWVLSIRPSAAR